MTVDQKRARLREMNAEIDRQIAAERSFGPRAVYRFEGTRIGVFAALLALMLMTVACSKLAVLQQIVDDTALAVPILEAAGVPIPPQVPAYVAAVANCIGMQPAQPTSAELLAISECLAKQIAPTLPPGLPQAVANIVALIVQDVQNYLNQNPVAIAVAKGARPIVKLSAGDLAKLQAMRAKAQATVKALRK